MLGRADFNRKRGLYAITQSGPDAILFQSVEQALRGGARLLQYRDKTASPIQRKDRAEALLALCRHYQVPLIINDDLDLALAIGAAGAHLGRDDPPLTIARARAPALILGVSCYNQLERACVAQIQDADYVAFGRFFPSVSKPAAAAAEIALLHQARAQLHLPLVAIGGITPQNGVLLTAAGADWLAVIDALFGAADIYATAQAFSTLFLEAPDDPIP